jgi:hypothetical protein
MDEQQRNIWGTINLNEKLYVNLEINDVSKEGYKSTGNRDSI